MKRLHTNPAVALLGARQAGKTVAIEIKSSSSPKLSKGNWSAFESLQPDFSFVIAPVDSTYPLGKGVRVMSLDTVIEEMKTL